MIANGQRVAAETDNPAFVSKVVDSAMAGALSLLKATEGNDVVSVQKAINKLFEGIGSTGESDATINNYASLFYLANGLNRKQALEALDAALNDTDLNAASLQQQINDTIALIGIIGGGGAGQATLGFLEFISMGDGIITDFPLSQTNNTGSKVVVFNNGVIVPQSDYSIVSNEVVFTTAPAALSSIEVFYFYSGLPDSVQIEVLSGTVNNSNTVFTYTGSPKTVDSINLFSNIYKKKTDYSVNLSTKTITFNVAPNFGQTPIIVYTNSTANSDSYQFNLGFGNGVKTVFGQLKVQPLSSANLLVMRNGLLVPQSEYTYSNGFITFDGGSIPDVSQEIDAIVFVTRKGATDSVDYKTISSAENTAREFRLAAAPSNPSQVLIDHQDASYLTYGVDFEIDNDTIVLNATTRSNAVVTNSNLRLIYKI